MPALKLTKLRPYTIPYALDVALRTLANYAVHRYVEPVETDGIITAGDTVEHCRVCNEWEGHTDRCPVPMIKAFYASA